MTNGGQTKGTAGGDNAATTRELVSNFGRVAIALSNS
jgi:hypothetical protein